MCNVEYNIVPQFSHFMKSVSHNFVWGNNSFVYNYEHNQMSQLFMDTIISSDSDKVANGYMKQVSINGQTVKCFDEHYALFVINR